MILYSQQKKNKKKHHDKAVNISNRTVQYKLMCDIKPWEKVIFQLFSGESISIEKYTFI